MNIKRYLTDNAIWLKSTGEKYISGMGKYEEIPIKCRFENDRKIVRNLAAKGNTNSSSVSGIVEVVSEALVICIEPIGLNDSIVYEGRQWQVLAVGIGKNVRGDFSHWEVRL